MTPSTPRPTRSSAVAAALVVLALLGATLSAAGGAWAVTRIPADSVGSKQIKDGTVTTDDLARALWTTQPGPRATPWSTQSFDLPGAPRGSYLARYTIAVDSLADQPPGAQLLCDARVSASGPLAASATAAFTPRQAAASGSWVFNGDPSDWSIRCEIYVAPDDGPVVEFPADMNLTSDLTSEITLLRVAPGRAPR